MNNPIESDQSAKIDTNATIAPNEDALNSSDGSSNRPGAAEIDPAILAELTRALLPYLGPYSITTVKRASRSTNDVREMVRMVSQHIDDLGKREMFTRSAKKILLDFRPEHPEAAVTSAPAHAHPANTGGRPATPITPELVKRGEQALAPIIGPLAGVLVQRYAKASANSRDFFEHLAGHLRSTEEKDKFFAEVRAAGNAARTQN